MCCLLNNFSARHGALEDTVLLTLEDNRIPRLREERVDALGNERLADILLCHWAGGRDAAVDFTVTHPLAASERPLVVAKAAAHSREAEESMVHSNSNKWERRG